MFSKRIIQRNIGRNCLEDNKAIVFEHPVINLKGNCNGREAQLQFDWNSLRTGTLVIGATGSGKSMMMKSIGRQLRDDTNEEYSMIISEVKKEYEPALFRKGDLILGQGEYSDRSIRWNIFKDLTYDGWDDFNVKRNCMEFSRQLFADKKNQSQQFFPDAAQLLLYQVMVKYIQNGRSSLIAREQMSNKGLVSFFAAFSEEQYRKLLEDCEEAGSIRLMLGESIDSPQALGVLGEEIITILSTFSDVFGEEGEFSIREFVQDKTGRALFLKIDPSLRETQRRIYGLIMNLAIKEALSGRNNNGNTILLCDELPFLGKIDLVSAVNLGRAKGMVCFAGLQSLEQIYDIYGEHEGNAILAGFCTRLLFRPNDPVTSSYIQHLFGTVSAQEIILSPGGCTTQNRQVDYIGSTFLQGMKTGDCICSFSGHEPFCFRLQQE